MPEPSLSIDGSQHAPLFPWYVLKVRVRSEALVGQSLERKDYTVFLPTFKETRHYSDRLKVVDTPLFSGYLFCRFDPHKQLPILTTPGVDHILTTNGEPEPVPESEVEAIQRVLHAGAAVRPWPFLKMGSHVQIVQGSFAGVEGILINERGADRLILSITVLQRSVSVEIDRTWVRPL